MVKINRLLATGLYTGYIPGAPGTYGSLLALILILFFPAIFKDFLAVIIIIAGGTICAGIEGRVTGVKDKQTIVIDEIAGLMLTCMLVDHKIWLLVAGFFLFRFFDILKPFPIDKLQDLPGGIGVMADDLLAGIYSLIILHFIQLIGG